MSVTSSSLQRGEASSASTRKKGKIDFEDSRAQSSASKKGKLIRKTQPPRPEEATSPTRIMASLISMLPNFSQQNLFGNTRDSALSKIEERLGVLEKRMSSDTSFRD